MSNRINWKKLAANLPHRVQVKGKIYYDILWQKDISDTKGNYLYGVTNLDAKTITIRMDMPAKLTVETFFHELFHAFSEEYKLNLTENQVLGLEHTIPFLIKLDLLKL